jgi:hypothetical protein
VNIKVPTVRKTAFYEISGLPLLTLAEDPNDKSPIHLLAEFLKNVSEFLFVIAPKILANIPTTKRELIDFLLKGPAEEKLNDWANRVLLMSFIENAIWYYILLGIALFATAVLIFKVCGYLLRLALKTKDYSQQEILSGYAGIESPLKYPFRYLLAQVVIFAVPIALVVGVMGLNDIMIEMANFLYGSTSIGGALYEIILKLLTLESAFWLWLSSGAIFTLIELYVIIYIAVNIAIIVMGSWMMFQVARYGDGRQGVEVITDSAWVVIRLIVLLVLLRVFWWLGPLFIAYAPDAGTSVVFWIVAWLSLMCAFPFLYLWILPKIERRMGEYARKAYQELRQPAPFQPRSALMQGVKGVEVVQKSTGETVIKIARNAYGLYRRITP